jgi:hypothetical protein
MMRRASSRSSDCFGLLILGTVNGICWKTKPGPMPATFAVDREAVTATPSSMSISPGARSPRRSSKSCDPSDKGPLPNPELRWYHSLSAFGTSATCCDGQRMTALGSKTEARRLPAFSIFRVHRISSAAPAPRVCSRDRQCRAAGNAGGSPWQHRMAPSGRSASPSFGCRHGRVVLR